MLAQIAVQNFALIDQVLLEFSPGMNVLTGETGAGKSILIDALNLVLGGRFDSRQFRDPSSACTIEAAFHIYPSAGLKELVSSFLEPGDDLVFLKREFSPDGRSRNSINGKMVNLSQMKAIGLRLVNIHGQNDQQGILDTASQQEILDRFAAGQNPGGKKFLEALEAFRDAYAPYAAAVAKRRSLLEAEEGREREIDLLQFQVKEIEDIMPKPGEDLELKEEHIRLAHAEKLYENTTRILEYLDEGDPSASALLSRCFRDWNDWARIDDSVARLKQEAESLQTGLEEIIRSVRDYRENLSFEEGRLREIEERMERMDRLKRKYGGEIPAVLEFLEQSRERLKFLLDAETLGKDLEAELARRQKTLAKAAAALTLLRKKAGTLIAELIEKELTDLGIRHGRFECRFTVLEEASVQGAERVEFFFSSNAGEMPKPLAATASGGEAARVMLAIKKVLARTDTIPTLIFDEIDANVGGRLGKVVGQKMKAIAAERQVMAITHLPQIASFAERHIKVEKSVVECRTVARYRVLEGEDKVRELAQMMSGEKTSEISREHAREMLESATD